MNRFTLMLERLIFLFACVKIGWLLGHMKNSLIRNLPEESEAEMTAVVTQGSGGLTARSGVPIALNQYHNRLQDQGMVSKRALEQLRTKLRSGTETVTVAWALRPAKDQKREGACTAYALSGAIEALLMSRYQIDAAVSADALWNLYRKPDLGEALRVSGSRGSGVTAVVQSNSRHHPFAAGTRLHVSIASDGFERIGLQDLPDVLAERYPVIFLSSHAKDALRRVPRSRPFVFASRGNDASGHAWLLSGVSVGQLTPDSLWLHLRNSWGAGWGRDGNAYLEAGHCALNACSFVAIKSLVIGAGEQEQSSFFLTEHFTQATVHEK